MNRQEIKDKLDIDSNYIGDTKSLHLIAAYKIIDELFDILEKERNIYMNDFLVDRLSNGKDFTHTFKDGVKVKLQGGTKRNDD